MKSILVLAKHFLKEIGFNIGLNSSQRVALVTELARFKQKRLSTENLPKLTMRRKEAEELCSAFLR